MMTEELFKLHKHAVNAAVLNVLQQLVRILLFKINLTFETKTNMVLVRCSSVYSKD